MGNIVTKAANALKHAVKHMLGRDFHPTPASTDAELEEWSDRVRAEISRNGFEQVFHDNLQDIAEVADTHPRLAPAYVQKWMAADRDMCTVVENHDPSELSQLDYKTGTRPDGATDHDIAPSAPVPGVVEKDGTFVKVYRAAQFANWGNTVENTPAYTFVPKTEVGVVNIVRFANKEGLRVRASGARHSWSDVFGNDGDVIISMMEPGAAVLTGRFDQPDANPQDNELENVHLDGTFKGEDGRLLGRVRLGAACTSDHFREWALKQDGGDWNWMIRALPILVSITSAGWTQPICHGAGINHQSVSDLCIEIRLVNCQGELQTITDKDQLKAVAGGFGMLGVITSQVFIADPMKIAQLFPLKVPTPLAVPPMSREDVPVQEDFDVSKYSDSELESATTTFEVDCNKFYSEWFWFPFQEDCWVNTWDVEDVGSDRPIYPSPLQIKAQNLELALARLFEVTFLKFISPEKQARLLGFAAMNFLPAGELLRTPVTEAVHFRRGIHRLPVRDVEVSIEIPLGENGQPDFSVCRRAWWESIQEVYSSLPDAPMRTTLEMRVVGGSETTLSTQRGNAATCAIEVLTNTLVSDEEWDCFVERIVARWSALKNEVTGEPLRIKPHWAKEWPKRMGGMNIEDFLKRAYCEEVPLFRQQMQDAATDGGYELKDALNRFGNDTMLRIIGGSG